MQNEHTFTVTLSGCTDEEALAAVEKFEKDAGCKVSSRALEGQPLHLITTADAISVLRRPLMDGEATWLREVLGVSLGREWPSAISGQDSPNVEEVRADQLTEGQTMKELGFDDWLTIKKIDVHGDTILLTGTDVDNADTLFSLDGDEVVEVLVVEAPQGSAA